MSTIEEFLKENNFKYRLAEFDELNFSEILKCKCKQIDAILPVGEVYFTIFKVKEYGQYLISRNPPPVHDISWVHKYKRNYYITSVDSFKI